MPIFAPENLVKKGKAKQHTQSYNVDRYNRNTLPRYVRRFGIIHYGGPRCRIVHTTYIEQKSSLGAGVGYGRRSGRYSDGYHSLLLLLDATGTNRGV